MTQKGHYFSQIKDGVKIDGLLNAMPFVLIKNAKIEYSWQEEMWQKLLDQQQLEKTKALIMQTNWSRELCGTRYHRFAFFVNESQQKLLPFLYSIGLNWVFKMFFYHKFFTKESHKLSEVSEVCLKEYNSKLLKCKDTRA